MCFLLRAISWTYPQASKSFLLYFKRTIKSTSSSQSSCFPTFLYIHSFVAGRLYHIYKLHLTPSSTLTQRPDNHPNTIFKMKFSAVIAAIISMAAFAIAAPVANEAVAARQNHGMCVKGTAAGVEQIEGC